MVLAKLFFSFCLHRLLRSEMINDLVNAAVRCINVWGVVNVDKLICSHYQQFYLNHFFTIFLIESIETTRSEQVPRIRTGSMVIALLGTIEPIEYSDYIERLIYWV